MTKEWIDQFNKKCAEFMGGKIQRDGWNFCLTDFGVKYCGYGFFEGFDLKFHSDWNWIHEVKEAIRKISTVNFSVTNNYAFINSVEKTENGGIGYTLGSYHGLSEKEATIQAIDQFIDWYNEQKKS